MPTTGLLGSCHLSCGLLGGSHLLRLDISLYRVAGSCCLCSSAGTALKVASHIGAMCSSIQVLQPVKHPLWVRCRASGMAASEDIFRGLSGSLQKIREMGYTTVEHIEAATVEELTAGTELTRPDARVAQLRAEKGTVWPRYT